MSYRQQLMSGAMAFIIAKKEDIRPELKSGDIVLPLSARGEALAKEWGASRVMNFAPDEEQVRYEWDVG